MKKRARAKKPVRAKATAKRQAPKATKAVAKSGTYTPTPIQGIGWAPFRYPLS